MRKSKKFKVVTVVVVFVLMFALTAIAEGANINVGINSKEEGAYKELLLEEETLLTNDSSESMRIQTEFNKTIMDIRIIVGNVIMILLIIVLLKDVIDKDKYKSICIYNEFINCDAIIFNTNINTKYREMVKKLLLSMCKEITKKTLYVLDSDLTAKELKDIQKLKQLDDKSDVLYSVKDILTTLDIVNKKNMSNVVLFSNIDLTKEYIEAVKSYKNIKKITVIAPKASYQNSFSKGLLEETKTVIYYI